MHGVTPMKGRSVIGGQGKGTGQGSEGALGRCV